MDLDELHRSRALEQDREHSRPQVLSDERLGIVRYRWDRRWPAPMRQAEAVDDVLGLDAGPHDHPNFRQPGADLGQLDRKGPLFVVERRRSLEKPGAFGVQVGEFLATVRPTPIPGRITNGGRHGALPRANERIGGSAANEADRSALIRHHPKPD